MKIKQWILLISSLVLLLIAAATTGYGIYLPVVMKEPTPTATSTSTATTTPTATFTSTATLTPTATFTSTATFIPTASITPTVTVMPQGVYILPNYSHYVDSINYLHIVGEVMNNSSNILRYVEIIVDVFNSNGQLVATDFTFTYLSNIPPWTRTCFDVSLQQPANWSYYQFEAPQYWNDGQPLPNLTVYGTSGSYNPTFGWYEIIGMVRNDGGVRVNYVSPIGTLYNVSGIVIGCDFTFVSSTDLLPGQSSSFDMTFLGRNYNDVASYSVQVDGDPQ
jgi:hypothetical protein